MQLDSGQFVLFLALVWVAWRLLPEAAAAVTLLAASTLFYAASSLRHLGLIVLVGWFNYEAMRKLTVWTDRKKRALLFAVVLGFDIGLLVFYKVASVYLTLSTSSQLLRDLFPVTLANTVAFPLGLSFFTFQMVACLTDVYRRKHQWDSGAGSFFLFALFFPQISAGPIPRASPLVSQLTSPRRLGAENLEAGVSLFAYGLFKKLVVANRLQSYAGNVFTSKPPASTIPVLLAFVFNALHLYADFSGYTDMARGSARVFGIELAENFNHPLLAESVTDFWRRWHMSLSSWLRDYLYKPLVFRIRTFGDNTAVICSISLTFLLCGLWHRFSWPFAVFGLWHGAALSLEFRTRQVRAYWAKARPWLGAPWLGRTYVFMFFIFTGALFRVDSMSQAWSLYGQALVPCRPASLAELFAHTGPILFILNFVALALWGLVAALRPVRPELKCAWFVLLCAALMLIFGQLPEGGFVYASF